MDVRKKELQFGFVTSNDDILVMQKSGLLLCERYFVVDS